MGDFRGVNVEEGAEAFRSVLAKRLNLADWNTRGSSPSWGFLRDSRCDCLSTNFCDSGEFSTTIHPHSELGDFDYSPSHSSSLKQVVKNKQGETTSL